jgi:hypothetical protein
MLNFKSGCERIENFQMMLLCYTHAILILHNYNLQKEDHKYVIPSLVEDVCACMFIALGHIESGTASLRETDGEDALLEQKKAWAILQFHAQNSTDRL